MQVKVWATPARPPVSLIPVAGVEASGTRQLGDSPPEGRTTSSQTLVTKQVPNVVSHSKMLLSCRRLHRLAPGWHRSGTGETQTRTNETLHNGALQERGGEVNRRAAAARSTAAPGHRLVTSDDTP